MRLAQDVARISPRLIAAQSLAEATAMRDGASTAAAASEAVAAAVEGDLIDASPTLRAKLQQIDDRLTALE